MPVITLLTDYGLVDEFVGVVHGVLTMLCPDARVIDVSHGIPRYDVRAGAATLEQSLPFMPAGVHVAVVDPYVGGARRAIALRSADGRMFVGPDNGLLWPACEASGGVVEAVDIGESPWRLEPVAATFHGRDIFAPVAAHLALGKPIAEGGAPLDPDAVVRLERPRTWVESGALVVSVTSADRFGNLQLGAAREHADELGLELGVRVAIRIATGETYVARYVRTFSDVDAGELILYEDAARRLAVALNQGSAAGRLGLQAGDELRIEPRG
jgi:S-adenosyl-L-methionine hydrolase (adenosine-forming)